MKEVKIYRKYWNRPGHRTFPVVLRNKGDQKCCLGFISEAFGASKEETLDRNYPCNLPRVTFPLNNIELALKAACINDNAYIPDKEREAELRNLFKEVNIKLVFTDKEQPKKLR